MSGISPLNRRLVPGLIENLGQATGATPKQSEVESGKFADMFKDLIQSVNDLGIESAQAQEAFLAGDPVELHQVMIKAEKAGVSMDLLLEIRNKLLDAYNTIMRMPM